MPLFSRSGVRNFFWKSKRKPPMEQPTNAPTYEDFEPFCTWQREEAQETLTVHLPEFRKEQLKVHISNTGLMGITGERPIDKTRTSRFIKEIKISNDCDPTRIHAKFSRGLLHVLLPKKVPPGTGQQLPAPSAKQAQLEIEQPRSRGPQQLDQVVKRPKDDDRAKHSMEVSDPKPGKKRVLVKAAAAMAAVLILLAVGAYAIFKHGTSEAGAGVCQSFS